jgi:hypothetical protein
MKYSILLAAVTASAVEAQKAQCQNTTSPELRQARDPFIQFAPGKATFPCDMGAAIPFGSVPTGCANFEIIVGQFW